MGSSHSTPPPLVQVSAPRGKVLVPPGTAFTVHPPLSYSRSQLGSYTRSAAGPAYAQYARRRARSSRRCHNTLGYGYGMGGTDIDIREETSEDGQNTPGDVTVDAAARRGKEGSKGCLTKGMGIMGPRGVSGRLDTLDSRPRSAPEMPGGEGYAGMPIGVPASSIGSSQQPSGLPPEYMSNPDLVGYGEDGVMPSTGLVSPHPTYPPGPLPSSSPPSSNGRLPPQPVPRGRPNHYEHVPMGAYTDTEKARKPPSSHVDPQQTSTRLNRGQSPDKKVGPPGQEWLNGDAFLDACTCTIDCKCRKGQRVLYRAREGRQKKGSDSDIEDGEYVSGEIRYILKDDLGRNCDDHTGCRKSESGSERQDRTSRKGENKNRKMNNNGGREERKRLQQQFQGFKDDLLEALDERLDDMRKEGRQRQRGHSPARPPWLGASGSGQGLYYMANGPQVDARTARQMGIPNYNLYGVAPSGIGPMPHGMASGLAAAGMRRRHGDDISDMGFDSTAIGMMNNGYMQPHMTMLKKKKTSTSRTRKAMRPNSTSHHGAKAGERQDKGAVEGNRRTAVDLQGPGGRGGMLGRHSNDNSSSSSSSGSSCDGQQRGAHRDDECDDFDVAGQDESWMRPNSQQRGGLEWSVKGRGGGRLDGSVVYGRTDISNSSSSRKGARQARADTDDDGEDDNYDDGY